MSTADTHDLVRKFRGCLALCFEPQSPLLATLKHMLTQPRTAIPHAFARLPTEQWHITLVTKAELRTLSDAAVAEAMALAPSRVFPIGIGGSLVHSVYFIVCMWPRAQSFRVKHGLPLQPFHVTLSTQNNHAIDKTIASLLSLEAASSLWMQTLSMDALEAVARQLLLDNTERALLLALDVATRVCTVYSTQTTRGWLRLGDAALELRKHKLAILSYAHVYDKLHADVSSGSDATALQRRCLAQMQTCSVFTEWGHVFSETECLEIPEPLFPFLLRQRWSQALCAAVRTCARATDRTTASREKLWTVSCLPDRTPRDAFYRLPRFFRWIVPFQLAVMSTPRNEQDIVHLARSVGIQHIVTLTREQPLERAWFPPLPQMIRNTHLAVTNYEAPSMAQIDLFIQSCCGSEGNDSSDAVAPVLVHCGGGKGRAGVMVACYLVAFGFRPPPACLEDWTQPALAADDAIRTLRAMRPGSIETPRQEAAVRAYSSLLWKRRTVLPASVDEPLASKPIVAGKPLETTDLLVLCGLPGSGKTTFREMLVKRTAASRTQQQQRHYVPWLELSGDEHGHDSCERSIGRNSVQRAILDRVNGRVDDRKAFLQLASTWSTHATAVWFDIPTDVCLHRAQQRPEHPTLAPGRRVVNAIAQHAREFAPPDLTEDFATVVRITSRDAAHELAQMLAPQIGLLRFPRTSHVINLGAATPDDLIMVDAPTASSSSPSPLGEGDSAQPDGDVVVLTEKLDGANLGISLASDGYTLVVQNRSHYVTSASHFQFRKLDAYVNAHQRVLRRILLQDPLVPERFVLYGEWLAATHSIAYTKLQDLFYAFDLYDRVTQQFWDRRSLEALLKVTAAPGSNGYNNDERIEIVPKLWSGPRLPDKDALITMARETPSQFYDGVIEGIYIKWESPGRGVKHRGKVVRGDFIIGNEHWSKGAIRLNTVVAQEREDSRP